MTIYKRQETGFFKWVFALVVFVLAMSLTFSDVYGAKTGGSTDQPYETFGNEKLDPPESVPEPSTLILISGGLGALYLLRRRNKSK